ncbi:MAG: hypothetical protein P4L50_20145 [Anaerolineaceae bacterium]|nr:hypothetical protein [Anaerolineaceae bacterium]
MDEFMVSLQTIIQSNIKELDDDLHKLIHEKYRQAIIRTGSWINPRIITVYISLYLTGNISDDSIDSVIYVSVSESNISIRVDIAKSNGEIIEDIWYEEITFRDRNEIPAKVDDITKKASELLAMKLKGLYFGNNQ